GIRDSLGHTLRLEVYDVTVASNGQEALSSLRDTGFDLVLLDVDMPVSDGWDTLGQIITVSLSLPLIVIKGCPDQQRLVTQEGVTAVLEKPLDLPLLLGVMGRALAETSEGRDKGTRPESR
ncbi:MAG TPA: response regulator, partial [Candidatus Saccharimonadales bacterium]|nr:response regulator [Candidatus Saccharimonadales bacterium]